MSDTTTTTKTEPTSSASAVPATAPAPAPTITIDGTAYEIPAMSVPMHLLADEIDEHLKSSRPNPMEVLVVALERLQKQSIPESIKTRLMDRMTDRALDECVRDCKSQHFDPQAAAAWLQTFDGGVWLLWRQLRQKYPAVELAKVRAAVMNRMADAARQGGAS